MAESNEEIEREALAYIAAMEKTGQRIGAQLIREYIELLEDRLAALSAGLERLGESEHRRDLVVVSDIIRSTVRSTIEPQLIARDLKRLPEMLLERGIELTSEQREYLKGLAHEHISMEGDVAP